MNFDVYQDGSPAQKPLDITALWDGEPVGESLAMTPEVAEKMLRTNSMTENQINTILGKQTVSWGDQPPILRPTEELIAHIKEKLAEKGSFYSGGDSAMLKDCRVVNGRTVGYWTAE